MARNRNTDRQLAVVPKLRHGEGAPVHISRQTVSEVDGRNSVIFQVDMSAAPVPDRKYVADTIGFLRGTDDYRLIFAQAKVAGPGYRSMLVVHISQDAINRIALVMSELVEGLGKVHRDAGVQAGTFVDIGEEPAQAVAFAANIIACGYSGREGTMDFYNTSSFGWEYALKKGESLPVDPIVRVSLPSALLMTIFKKMGEVATEQGGEGDAP